MDRFRRDLIKLIKDERGNVLILVTFLLIFIFFGIAALSVDAGNLYLHRRHQQNTADAAALAAAWELPGPESTVRQVAMQYVDINDKDINEGDDNNNVEVTVFDSNRKVRVEITKEHSLYFALAPPIGQTEADVYATAVATKNVPGLELLPFIMLDYTDLIGDEYRYFDYDDNLKPVYEYDDGGDHYNLITTYGDYNTLWSNWEWGDWANDIEAFKKVLCDIINCCDCPVKNACEDPDHGAIATIYKRGQNAGHWGIVDFTDHSDQGSQNNATFIKKVLAQGLDEPFCQGGGTRTARPGYVAAIDEGVPNEDLDDAIELKLSERLERDKDIGYYVMLLLPGPASYFQGESYSDFNVSDLLIGYFRTLESKGQGNQPGNESRLEGLLLDVFKCGELDPSSWHGRVYLIE